MGFINDYNRRVSQSLQGTHKVNQKAKFFATPSRPGNFGQNLDLQSDVDNWFDQNRTYNEQQPQIKKTQLYTLGAIYYGALLSFARVYAMSVIGRLNGWKRYDKDTYMQVDISQLPPSQVLQIVWNGMPVFVRRLTKQQIHQEEHQYCADTLLDKGKEVFLSQGSNTKILVCSAICTHLGCIPIPYLGAFGGWVCICHGSVYDKYGRVRQGPALQNLPYINNTAYQNGTILCIEELKFPREPSLAYWSE